MGLWRLQPAGHQAAQRAAQQAVQRLPHSRLVLPYCWMVPKVADGENSGKLGLAAGVDGDVLCHLLVVFRLCTAGMP
jgi:hypothetical protein